MFARARLRLVASYVAILGVILTGLSIVVFILFQNGLYSDVDVSLRFYGDSYAVYLAQHSQVLPTGSCFVPPFSLTAEASEAVGYVVTDCNHNIVDFNMQYSSGVAPADLSRALTGNKVLRTIQRGNHYWRTYTVPILVGTPQHTVVVGAVQLYRLVDGQVESLHRLEGVLIGGGLGALALATVAALFLAGRTLRPIRVAFDSQRRFIADASHELRTPLTLIRGSAEMIATTSQRLQGEDAELLDDIVNEVDRMGRLVTDLLTLARVDNAQIQLRHEPVDVGEIVRESMDDLSSQGSRKGLTMKMRVEGGNVILGDDLRLRQLVLILLDNAIKYTPAGGSIFASVQGTNGHVCLSVDDTGQGIPAEAIPHVFERFFRADTARTHESGGSGLGLSIADWIVKAHRGRIDIASVVGKGTRVMVELPSAISSDKVGPRLHSLPTSLSAREAANGTTEAEMEAEIPVEEGAAT